MTISNLIRKLFYLLPLLCWQPVLAALPLHQLKLPPGFRISIFAENIPNARSMTLGDRDTVFVGSRGAGKVYALRDSNGDGVADIRHIVARNLNSPNGVAFRDGSLYVAEINRILRFDRIESRLPHPLDPYVVVNNLPKESHHGWRYIDFGPDGLLYVGIGAPCNICDRKDYGLILRMKPDGSARKVFANGVRNTVGFDWHPDTRELWFTDNGRDLLGDDLPPDEVNKAAIPGMHFGFPHCHGGTVLDPEFGQPGACYDYTAPEWRLGAHVAPLGLRFYTGGKFPEKYHKQIFVAEHGSWNRSSKVGYRVIVLLMDNGKVVRQEPFIEGWLQGQNVWGRPMGLLVMPNGDLLVSDDKADVIYRVYYQP